MLTPANIKKFKELYFKRYGVELSDEELLEAATKLLDLVEAVYRPMKKKELPPENGPP